MKTIVITISVVIFLVTFSINYLLCQTTENQTKDQKLRTFGIGVNIQPDIGFDETPSQLIFSLNVDDIWRIEPRFGFSSSSILTDDEEEDRSSNVVGFGVYGLKYISQILFTYGIEYNHFSYTSDIHRYGIHRKSEDKANGIGPSLGLEYLIGKHFSFGAVFSIIYLKEIDIIDRDITDGIINEENETKEWATKAGLQFRFYF